MVDTRLAPSELCLREQNAALKAELTEMRAHVEELERLADTDTLIALPNRRCFLREVDRVVRHVTRYDSRAAVLFVDVDGLKAINDRYGHRIGDAALIHVGTILAREVRAADLVARIGGDEFGLMLEHLDEAAALAKAEALIAAVALAPFETSAGPIAIRLSVGTTMIGGGDDVHGVLARADAQMYAAKAAQRADR